MAISCIEKMDALLLLVRKKYTLYVSKPLALGKASFRMLNDWEHWKRLFALCSVLALYT